jgi:hypothetical protein
MASLLQTTPFKSACLTILEWLVLTLSSHIQQALITFNIFVIFYACPVWIHPKPTNNAAKINSEGGTKYNGRNASINHKFYSIHVITQTVLFNKKFIKKF